MQDTYNRDLYRDSNKTDLLAVSVAFVATLLIHISVYYLTPNKFASFEDDKKNSDELKIEILPPKFERKLPEFIEANPFGNNEKPTSPNAPESYKDQRAADEIPDPTSKSKKPFVEGEIEDGKKIVSGNMDEQNEPSPTDVLETLERPLEQPAQPTELTQPSQQQLQPSQQSKKTEDSSETNQSGETEESIGETSDSRKSKLNDDKNSTAEKSNIDTTRMSEDEFIKVEKVSDKNLSDSKDLDAISKKEKHTNKIQKQNYAKTGDKGEAKTDKIKGEDSPHQQPSNDTRAPQKETSQTQPEETPKENLPPPRPRPTLSMKIPAGPLANNPSRASNRGVVSCDSRFSEFGAYQQRMIEAISRQWNLIGSKYDLSSAIGSFVIIEYYLNTMGELSKFQIIHTTSTNTGTGLCEQAILTTAPYGEWTQEMVNTFGGQDQSVRITFHYR